MVDQGRSTNHDEAAAGPWGVGIGLRIHQNCSAVLLADCTAPSI